MNLDAALQTYIAECSELLDAMEAALLGMEPGGDTGELIADVFRAAHTIKGSSGVFGFDDVVAFTHEVESLLDAIRDGRVELQDEHVALLLECGDHARALVDIAASSGSIDAALRERDVALLARLRTLMDGAADAGTEHVAGASASGSTAVASVDDASRLERIPVPSAVEHWHISLRFGPEVIRNGMDPLSFLRYLRTLGTVLQIDTLLDRMPAASEMDPEVCYLGCEIALQSTADKAAIEGVFEFVRDDCELRIVPPGSEISAYLDLIADLPADALRIGDMLVRSGALTRTELERALTAQARAEDAAPAQAEDAGRRLGEILVEQGAVSPVVVAAALDKQKNVREQKANEARFIRVDASKLDQLIDLVGELVISGAGIQLLSASAGQPAITESAAGLLNLVEEVRNTALGLRMVQIGATFQRFQRVVRDVSQSLGKDISLVINGAETELDKSVVEKIGDPLMHLVRNAMDHGIETAQARQAAGKPVRATVKLNAYHDSGSIVIEVSDDGAGLNRDRILAKAKDRGIVPENAALSDREIYNLIFSAGFSTAEKISDLSGRGVGMDVVRRNIEALRGAVELDSRPGRGTTVRIRLPLTLAIIDGFVIGVGDARYVIPVDMIVECVELTPAHAALARDRGYTDLRGSVLPVRWLCEMLGVPGGATRRQNIVVVRCNGRRMGFVVDTLLGEAQAVIKPLGRLFAQLNGISGSTIMGDGGVALILDVAALVDEGGSMVPVGASVPLDA